MDKWAAGEAPAEIDGGPAVSLAMIKDASERAHLARMYVMTKGLEEIGTRMGLVPVFLTLTLPPEYHPHPTARRRADDADEMDDGDDEVVPWWDAEEDPWWRAYLGRSWTASYGPLMACTTLQETWALLRSQLHNRGVSPIGLRVTEPHADGCPHMHAMLWVQGDQVATVSETLDRCLPWQAPGGVTETGLKGRCIVVDAKAYEAEQAAQGKADARGASAAGYLLKYIRKSMAAVDVSPREREAAAEFAKRKTQMEAAQRKWDRVRAQMSELGVRRLGFLGVHGIQRIWQRI